MRAFLAATGLLLLACELPEYEFTNEPSSDASTDGAGAVGGSGGIGASGGSGGSSASGGTGGTGAGGGTGGSGGSGGSGGAPGCDPTSDQCPSGYYCASDSLSCKPGCKNSGECIAPLACDPTEHKCLGCSSDDDCVAGQICDTGTTACVPGCTPTHDCQSGYTCCSGQCALLPFDPQNCGTCGNVCPPPPNGTADCQASKCTVKCTVLGSADCNKLPSDGCEIDTKTDANNCGICGKVCSPSQSCTNGVCS